MKNTLETRLGIFFALALVVAVVILEMIGGTDLFQSGYQITSNFKNAQDLKKGDLVKMAGVEVGRVDKVELVSVNGVPMAKVAMKIKGDYEIKTDAKAIIKFTGLMGQNFVAIEGGSARAARIAPGTALESAEQPDLSTLMIKLESVASGVEGLTKSFSTDNISTLLGPLTDFIKQSAPELRAMIANLRQVSDNLAQGKGTVGKLIADDALYNSALGAVTNLQSASTDLKGLMNTANSSLADVRGLIQQINSGQGTLGKLAKDEKLYNEFTLAATNLREILEKMNRGQGTVGKLINEDDFYKNAKLSLQKLDKATEGLEDQGPLSVLGIVVNNLF
jgi:phospholipid/cholesterol/gamma-HCH transport system substrate-binding protein